VGKTEGFRIGNVGYLYILIDVGRSFTIYKGV